MGYPYFKSAFAKVKGQVNPKSIIDLMWSYEIYNNWLKLASPGCCEGTMPSYWVVTFLICLVSVVNQPKYVRKSANSRTIRHGFVFCYLVIVAILPSTSDIYQHQLFTGMGLLPLHLVYLVTDKKNLISLISKRAKACRFYFLMRWFYTGSIHNNKQPGPRLNGFTITQLKGVSIKKFLEIWFW